MTSRSLTICLAAGIAAFSAALPAAPALAIGGKSDNGDGYLNDEMRNPRFIEPGGWRDAARYRASNPRAGYEDRVLAEQGYDNEGSGPVGRPYRGRVLVQPYHAR